MLFFILEALHSPASAPVGGSQNRSSYVGDTVESLLDFANRPAFDAVSYAAFSQSFVPSAGKTPVYGLKYFANGRMWIRLVVPKLDAEIKDRLVRLNDSRVLDARLVVVEPDGFREILWTYNSAERTSGSGTRVPVFRFQAEEIEGKTIMLGFLSRGALRASLYFETPDAFVATETSHAIRTMIVGGFLIAIGGYLLIMGLILKERNLYYLSGMSFFLGTFIVGGEGYVGTKLVAFNQVLADVIVYGSQPVVMGFSLMFLESYLDVAKTHAKLSAMIRILAVILPFQGLYALTGEHFHWRPKIWIDNSVPVLIGLLVVVGVLAYFIAQKRASAIRFAICFAPIILFSFGRLLAYWTAPLSPLADSILNSFYDIPLTMALLAVVVMADVPRRERDLRAVAEDNENRFRRYAEIASDSFFEVSPDGRILRATGTVTKDIGLMTGIPFQQFLDHLDPQSGSSLAAFMASGGERRTMEVHYQPQLEDDRWLSLNAVSQNGLLTGTISDVTAQVRLREQENRRHTLASLGQLASGVAHEVNNLLHPIVNLTRHVRDRLTADPESKRILSIVMSSGEHAGRIVANVLRSFGPGQDAGEPVEFHLALQQAVESVQSTLPLGVSLTAQITQVNVAPVAFGTLLQILSNLTSNSVRAMHGAGNIAITFSGKPSGGALLRFEDDGPGIPSELMDSVFLPFVSGRRDGTGLGLSLVATLVHAIKGEVEIERNRAKGACILINLPEGADHAEDPDRR